MAYSGNPTARRFRTDMLIFANQLKGKMEDNYTRQAEELAGNMRRNVPEDKGVLKASIRTKNITRNYGNRQRVSVLVIAGGPTTTRRTATGTVYDYALAQEFGTSEEAPQPFFYSAARLYAQVGRQSAAETLATAIEENNRVRELRANNYSNASITVSVGGRGGAEVIRGKL